MREVINPEVDVHKGLPHGVGVVLLAEVGEVGLVAAALGRNVARHRGQNNILVVATGPQERDGDTQNKC